MYFTSSVKLLSFFKQVRHLTGGLILNNCKELNLKRVYKIVDPKKSVKKKTKKKQIIVKKVSDDIEAIWLENLKKNNVMLFRKTSFGSFKKVNMENLLVRLREIYPASFESSHIDVNAEDKDSSTANSEPSVKTRKKKSSKKEIQNAVNTKEIEACPPSESTELKIEDSKSLPCLSESLLKNIFEFPMLKKENENTVSHLAKLEAEDFGSVDAMMFPSVTGILKDTMSNANRLKLLKWKAKMVADLGADKFQKYMTDLLLQGSKFHATLKTYLEVSDKSLVTIHPTVEGCWKSVENVLPQIGKVQFIEESIHHPVLMYKGIVDCVAEYRGTPCVIEWKRASNAKLSLAATYDAPLQVCAYLGALPWHKNVTIERGLIVIAYEDGSPANVFELSLESCELHWMKWLQRVHSYWLKKSSVVIKNNIEV